MPQHYTKDTTEAPYWCKTCGRHTQHAVSFGRIGHCLEHGPKVNERGENRTQQKAREKREKDKREPKLF